MGRDEQMGLKMRDNNDCIYIEFTSASLSSSVTSPSTGAAWWDLYRSLSPRLRWRHLLGGGCMDVFHLRLK